MEKLTQTMSVIMLPTNKASRLYLLKDKLCLFNKLVNGNEFSNIINQHLYLVSNAEIKEGDWKYCSFMNNIMKYHLNSAIEGESKCENCRKIVATTDISLDNIIATDGKGRETCFEQLSQIPQSFIEEYVKSNGNIKTVGVEMVYNPGNRQESEGENHIINHCMKIKTTPNNEIIIVSTNTSEEVDVEKLAEEYFTKVKTLFASKALKELAIRDFIAGFKAAQQNQKEFSLEDMKKAYGEGTNEGAFYESLCRDEDWEAIKEFDKNPDRRFDKLINSLKSKSDNT